jgi:hypothetical protein
MNSGDITLTNVLVTIANGAKLIGPLTLARGENEDFSTTYNVGTLLNVIASAMDACTGLTATNADSCGQIIPRPAIVNLSKDGTVVTLSWTSMPGTTYRVQSSPSLNNSAWVDAPGDVTATGTSCSKSIPITTGKTTLYYRVTAFHN